MDFDSGNSKKINLLKSTRLVPQNGNQEKKQHFSKRPFSSFQDKSKEDGRYETNKGGYKGKGGGGEGFSSTTFYVPPAIPFYSVKNEEFIMGTPADCVVAFKATTWDNHAWAIVDGQKRKSALKYPVGEFFKASVLAKQHPGSEEAREKAVRVNIEWADATRFGNLDNKQTKIWKVWCKRFKDTYQESSWYEEIQLVEEVPYEKINGLYKHSDGSRKHFVKGILHNGPGPDDPAIIWRNGLREWYEMNVRSRYPFNGPAVIVPYQDRVEFWYKGEYLDPQPYFLSSSTSSSSDSTPLLSKYNENYSDDSLSLSEN